MPLRSSNGFSFREGDRAQVADSASFAPLRPSRTLGCDPDGIRIILLRVQIESDADIIDLHEPDPVGVRLDHVAERRAGEDLSDELPREERGMPPSALMEGNDDAVRERIPFPDDRAYGSRQNERMVGKTKKDCRGLGERRAKTGPDGIDHLAPGMLVAYDADRKVPDGLLHGGAVRAGHHNDITQARLQDRVRAAPDRRDAVHRQELLGPAHPARRARRKQDR